MSIRHRQFRDRLPHPRVALASALAFGLWGCALLAPPAAEPPPITPAPQAKCDESIFRRASEDRSSYFELEAKRLRADLKEAESAMVAIESGMRSRQTRADAVSVLAEARIAIERASDGVPWRTAEAAEAMRKLDEAEKQLQESHLGTAIFFASRARRIADTLNEEARHIGQEESTRFIRAKRVNLRSGPSTKHAILGVLLTETPVFPEETDGQWLLVRTLTGQVGWVHGQLLQ